jgi:hypothetical protein
MKPRDIYVFVVFLLIAACKDNSALDARIEEILREGWIEPRERVFSGLNGADRFIEKFALSSQETEMVGGWHSWLLSEKDGEWGIGLAISFLPNRIFIAFDYEVIPGERDNRVLDKIGYWKIERGKLMIRPVYIYTRTDVQPPGAYNEKGEIETSYYPVWKPALHEQAAVQKTTFYYNKIPAEVKSLFSIDEKDFNRKRSVIALPFDAGSSDLYAEGKPWHGFLMNPDIDDEQYIHNLRVMFTTGGERSYNFEENRYGLDFSRWE